MRIKHQLSATLLVLTVALPIGLTPVVARAETPTASVAAYTPRIESFTVQPLDRASPGSDLYFTLNGAPGADVSLQMVGSNKVVRMTEEQPGRYEAAYTIRSSDRITAESLVTARMVRDGKSVTATLDKSVVAGAPAPIDPRAPKISSFVVNAPDRVQPGDELSFSLSGLPDGRASVAVKGVKSRIALTEASRGVYEGSYTVRRDDRLNGAIAATGYLSINKQESSKVYERGTPVAQACANCGVVESVNAVQVKDGSSNALGTVAGGVLGGVLGHQVGNGTGKDLATIAGAVGGAYAGNRVQNNMAKKTEYRVVVRLQNKTTQTFTYAADPGMTVGKQVKIENKEIVLQ